MMAANHWQFIVAAVLGGAAALLPGWGSGRRAWISKFVLFVSAAGFTAWGTQAQSRRQAEAAQQANQVLRADVSAAISRIDSLKQAGAVPSQFAGMLDETRVELQRWADDFAVNRSRKAVDHDQAILRQRAAELRARRPGRDFVMTAANIVRGALEAYNARNPRKVSFDLPSVPEDLDKKQEWRGKVQFAPNVIWSVSAYSGAAYGSGPNDYVFRIVANQNRGEMQDEGYFCLRYKASGREGEKPTWSSSADGKYFVPSGDFWLVDQPMIDVEKEITQLLLHLIEVQLLMADQTLQTER